MNPWQTGKNYDKIAHWWHNQHLASSYGVSQVERAISYCKNRGTALDVGCGSGGRLMNTLLSAGFEVTGVDVSEKMVEIARSNHPEVTFHIADIVSWQAPQKFDFIVAWDSIFHLPLAMQAPVVTKLCQLLQPNGILVYTFGDGAGEHQSEWHNDTFHYSTLGVSENLKVIMANGCQCRHLELDQFPEKHVYLIAQKE